MNSKKLKMVVFGFAAVMFSAAARSEFSAEQLIKVTEIAVKDFQTANAEHAAHLTGFKSWKSGENAKVKVYVNHNGSNMEFNFECHNHDGHFECHAH